MRTKNSIDLKKSNQRCNSLMTGAGCSSMTGVHKDCGTYRCPFYKPQDCGDWIRVEDKDGISLIPPEEYKCERLKTKKKHDYSSWKIISVRCAGSH